MVPVWWSPHIAQCQTQPCCVKLPDWIREDLMAHLSISGDCSGARRILTAKIAHKLDELDKMDGRANSLSQSWMDYYRNNELAYHELLMEVDRRLQDRRSDPYIMQLRGYFSVNETYLQWLHRSARDNMEKLSEDAWESLKKWKEESPDDFPVYALKACEVKEPWTEPCLVYMDKVMLQMALGHLKATLFIDATFSTNHNKYTLTVFMVRVKSGRARPIAYMLSCSENGEATKRALHAIKDRIATQDDPQSKGKKAVWAPKACVMDMGKALVSAVSSFFSETRLTSEQRGVPIWYCSYHLGKAWADKMASCKPKDKPKDTEDPNFKRKIRNYNQMTKDLYSIRDGIVPLLGETETRGALIPPITSRDHAKQLLDAWTEYYDKKEGCETFVKYIKDSYSKETEVERWCRTCKPDTDGHTTNNVQEGFNRAIKEKLGGPTKASHTRLDRLILTLKHLSNDHKRVEEDWHKGATDSVPMRKRHDTAKNEMNQEREKYLQCMSKEPALGKNEPKPYDAQEIDLAEVEGYLKASTPNQPCRFEDLTKRKEWWNNVKIKHKLYQTMGLGRRMQLWRVKGIPREEWFEGRPYSIVCVDAVLNATCSCNRHEGDDKCKHIHAVALKYPDQERYVIAGIRPYVSPVTGRGFHQAPNVSNTDVSNTDRIHSSSLIEQPGESELQEDYKKVARYILNSFRMKRHDHIKEIKAYYDQGTSLRKNAWGMPMRKQKKNSMNQKRKNMSANQEPNKKKKAVKEPSASPAVDEVRDVEDGAIDDIDQLDALMTQQLNEPVLPGDMEALHQRQLNDQNAIENTARTEAVQLKQNARAESKKGTKSTLTSTAARLRAAVGKRQPLTQPSDNQLTQPNGPT
jgi:hypothetical protein